MNEKLLHLIWDRQLFSAGMLRTRDDEKVEVIDTGSWNMDQGPDFLNARVRLDGRLWVGHVEMHVRSSHWDAHGHQFDHNYDNVILHVVWQDDGPPRSRLPLVELQPLVPSYILKKYTDWMWKKSFVPCSAELPGVEAPLVYPWLNGMARQRYQQRAERVRARVKELGMDWQEAFWEALARSFGHKVNADAFESMASTLPYNLLLKRRSQLMQLEALLLGQAGLLRADADSYAQQLFGEYSFLRKKYQLKRSYVPAHFLRMRPCNFPTVRLAQLAMLIHRVPDLFRMVKDIRDPALVFDLLKVEASSYWDTHYRFGEPSVASRKVAGDQFVGNVVVNTVIPFIVAYNMHIGNHRDADRVFDWMKEMPEENNTIVREFRQGGLPARQMLDTQGLLELHKRYCSHSRCAECAIGRFLLRHGPV